MNAVWQKIKADIVGRPVMAGLITLTIVAASALLTLALATLFSLNAPYDHSFAELNGAHLMLNFNRDRVRASDIALLQTLPGVAADTGLEYSLLSRVEIRGARVWVSIRSMPAEMPSVNRLWIRTGRYLAPGPLELLGSTDLNYLNQLSVGDTVTVTASDGKDVSLPVVGLAYHPMWDTYRSPEPPYVYVSAETFRALFPDEGLWDWSLGLRLTDPDSVEAVLRQAQAVLRADAIDHYTDWRDVRRSAVFGVQLNVVFLSAFSLFAISGTALVVASNISATVLSQFKQIGILKAIGFTQTQILLLYIGQYLVLSLIGSGIGIAAGLLLAPLPLRSVAASMNTAYQPPLNPWLVLLVAVIVAVIVTLATASAAYRGARANIIQAIAIGAEAPTQKMPLGARVAARLGLPMVVVLGLNEVFARPFRSLMTALSLMLGVVGMVFSLTLNETLDSYRADPSLLGIEHDAMITAEETSLSRMNRLLRDAPGVVGYYRETVVTVETALGQSFRVRAVEGQLAAFPFRVPEGRFFQPDTSETIAGRGLLDWLGLKVGDEIVLASGSRQATWRIVGQYVEPADAGQMLMVSQSALDRLGLDSGPGVYYLKLAADANPAALKHYIDSLPESDLALTIVSQAIPDTVLYLQQSILALGAILIGVAVVNVFNTSLMSARQKVRTIGILKTVGMTPGQVMAMINASAGTLGLFAVAAGLPLGLAVTRWGLDVLARFYGLGRVSLAVNGWYLLLLIPAFIAISVLGSYAPSRWAAGLPVTRVLQHE